MVQPPDALGVVSDGAWNRFEALGGASTLRGRARLTTITPAALQVLTAVSQAWCSIAVNKADSVLLHDADPRGYEARPRPAGSRRTSATSNLRMLGVVASDAEVDALYEGVFLKYEAQGAPIAWTRSAPRSFAAPSGCCCERRRPMKTSRRALLAASLGLGQLALLERFGMLRDASADTPADAPTKLLSIYLQGGWRPQYFFCRSRTRTADRAIPPPQDFVASHLSSRRTSSSTSRGRRQVRTAPDRAPLGSGEPGDAGAGVTPMGYAYVKHELWEHLSGCTASIRVRTRTAARTSPR